MINWHAHRASETKSYDPRRRGSILQVSVLRSHLWTAFFLAACTVAACRLTAVTFAQLPWSNPSRRSSQEAKISVKATSELHELLLEVQAIEHRESGMLRNLQSILRLELSQEAKLLRATSVGGRFVFVLDNVFPDEGVRALYESLQTESFVRAEFSRPDSREYKHYVVSYNLGRIQQTAVFRVVSQLVHVLFPGEEWEPFRAYTNAVQFSDVAFSHRDAPDADKLTVLIYTNPEWAHEHAGETIFYDEDGEPVETVQPARGRVVLFQGNIMHKGSPPGRLFHGNRFTTAIKFVPRRLVAPG